MLSVFFVNCTFKNGIKSFFVENLCRIFFMPKLLQIFQWFFAFVSTFNIAHFITILSLLFDQTVSDVFPCQSVSLIFTRNRVHVAHVFFLLLYLQFTLHLLVPDQLVQNDLWCVMLICINLDIKAKKTLLGLFYMSNIILCKCCAYKESIETSFFISPIKYVLGLHILRYVRSLN